MSENKKITKAIVEKQAVVAEIKEKLAKSKSVVFVEYKGLTVAEDTALRSEFRKGNVEYKVYKNTLIKRALGDLEPAKFEEKLAGTTAVAFAADEVAAAKIVAENSKKLNDKLKVKCGILDGAYVDEKGVATLAGMPSKEVLIAKMLGSFNAPITNFVGVLSALPRGLVCALNAIAQKKAQ